MTANSSSAISRRSAWKRILSLFLAFVMLIVCVPTIPSADIEADAFGRMPGFGWGGPNVLTNASVKFKDGSGTVIGEVDSGEMF